MPKITRAYKQSSDTWRLGLTQRAGFALAIVVLLWLFTFWVIGE